MNHSKAKEIAVATCYKLQPHCKDGKVKIVGSTRRLKPEVKDIEIIVIPKKQDIKDLFGAVIGKDVDRRFIETVNNLGEIIKGKAIGKIMQIKLPEIMLDLFIPDYFDYYRQYAIRTGSSDYSARVIATGWKKIGWCGSDKGLRKISDCIEIKGSDGKSKWKCVNEKAELPPCWQSEEEFFEWIKVFYIKPENRI